MTLEDGTVRFNEEVELELEALTAIFSEDDLMIDRRERCVELRLNPAGLNPASLNPAGLEPQESDGRFRLRAFLPEGYPATDPPLLELSAPYLPEDAVEPLVTAALALWQPGESALFSAIDLLREEVTTDHILEVSPLHSQLHDSTVHIEAKQTDDKHSRLSEEEEAIAVPISALVDWWQQRIVSGNTIVDRKSVFQGHVCKVSSVHEVQKVQLTLLSNHKIARAAHNVMAYRIRMPRGIYGGGADQPLGKRKGKAVQDQGVLLQDCDSDGESAAGGRLAHLLELLDLTGVVVVVTRWYGGILLGPDRFKHINNAARDAFECAGMVEKSGKKR